MRLEIDPTPSPEEERALAEALAHVAEQPHGVESLWWGEGVLENVATEGPDELLDASQRAGA